jgi:hypothetical protein
MKNSHTWILITQLNAEDMTEALGKKNRGKLLALYQGKWNPSTLADAIGVDINPPPESENESEDIGYKSKGASIRH